MRLDGELQKTCHASRRVVWYQVGNCSVEPVRSPTADEVVQRTGVDFERPGETRNSVRYALNRFDQQEPNKRGMVIMSANLGVDKRGVFARVVLLHPFERPGGRDADTLGKAAQPVAGGDGRVQVFKACQC